MPPKDVDRMANSVDPDPTAPLEQSDQKDIHVPIFKIFTVLRHLEISRVSNKIPERKNYQLNHE